MKSLCEVLVVGAGMAGVSAAAILASSRSVVLLEREESAGTHSTGRSAALYAPSYGEGVIRALTKASGSTFRDHEQDEDVPILRTRATLLVAVEAKLEQLHNTYAKDQGLFDYLDGREVEVLVPIFRENAISAALIDRSSADIDVDRLLQLYMRQLRRAGGDSRMGEAPLAINAADGGWRVLTSRGEIQCNYLVDAAGAWADEIATMANVTPIRLSPRRRTAALVDAPDVVGFDQWPNVIDINDDFYFKPDAGKLLVSPAEETEVEPHDAYADDEALAEGLDRIMRLTTLTVKRAPRSWGGLRTFAPDRVPVIGFAPDSPAPFLWLAGQGGYGIQTAPAAAELAAYLINRGVRPSFADDALIMKLSPARFESS